MSKILIDSRVGSKELIDFLPPQLCELTSLDFGDIMFGGNGANGVINIIIERKELSDLIASMRSGRFQDYQLPGMYEWADVAYLIVEGGIRKSGDQTWLYRKGKWCVPAQYVVGYSELYGYIYSLQESSPIRVLQTLDLADTAAMILALYSYWGKLYSAHKSIATTYTGGAGVSFARMPLRRRFASLLRGVKAELSNAAAERFDTITAMLIADAAAWQEIKGIGAAKSKSIVAEIALSEKP